MRVSLGNFIVIESFDFISSIKIKQSITGSGAEVWELGHGRILIWLSNSKTSLVSFTRFSWMNVLQGLKSALRFLLLLLNED